MKSDEQLREMEMVGRRIRAARKAARLTIEKASELADCNPRFLGEIERGYKRPSLQTILVLAKALQVPPAFFFKTDEEENPAVLVERLKVLLGKCSTEQLKMTYRVIQSILQL